jgi:localization factor PodJL
MALTRLRRLSSAAPACAIDAAPAFERAANRLEDIAEKLARISIGESATAARFGIHAAGPSQDSDAVHKVLSRVESNERQTVEAFTAVNERLAGLSRQLASTRQAPAARPEDSAGFQTLEKAVRSIVEHMETSEKRNKDTFKSLADRIASMSAKAQTTDSEQVLRQAPAFSQLESRLSDLVKRVERSEASPQHQTLSELLRREITDLAKRIDQVRENSEVLASKAQTQAVQASQQELRAIEGRILGLLKEAQSSLSNATVAPAEMQRLRGEVERLNRRIDESQGQQGPDPDVLELRSAVEQLSTRVAQGPDMRPLVDMDRRILDITQRLEQTQAATRSLPQFAELENRIAELDYRFNEAIAGRASAHSAELEERIAEVSERLGRTEQQLASVETIERAVNQLFDTIEQQRKWTEEVAEGAANRMAQQIMAAGPQQVSLAGSPEIQALEQGLHAVRTAAESADQRNQETLEAVHDTLEQIVGKLAELETAAIGQRVAAAAAAPLAAGLEQMAPAVSPVEVAPTVNPFEASYRDEPQAQAMAPIQPAPTGFNDLSAGNPFAEIHPAPVSPAFAPMGAQMGAAGLDETMAGGDDFIAAARRAAQAAAQQKSLLGGISPGAAKMSEESSKKLLNLSFFKKKPKTEKGPVGLSGEIKPPPGFKPANSNTENKRRKLLLMGLVLLAAVSAFTFNMMGRSHKPKAPVAPAAIEQSIQQNDAGSAADDADVDAPDAAAPASGGTAPAPAAPAPAPLESGGLMDDEPDPILTGSLPQTYDTKSISALVAGEAAAPENMPPAEVGNLALREAAALGNANAQFVIATRYLNGEKVGQDYEKAAYWYGKAAVAGNAPAQYRVATMYERGRGVAKDLSAALGWYERAASLGNVRSMHNAAVLASGSELGTPDYKRAFKWFSLAAAHGMKDSQFNLAVLLERGLGTEINKADAWFWYSIAAQQDDADAKTRASALGKTMSQSEMLAAKTRLAAWSPEKAPDSANVVAVDNAAWNATAQVGG